MPRVKGANRLVKVRASSDADRVIQQAAYDGTGRRIRKIVANSGDLDGTFGYIYDGWKIAQVSDGSGNMVQQFIALREPALDAPRATTWHVRAAKACAARGGESRVDELVMMRAAGRGDLYIHQDANWNVIALTDLGGSVVERYTYTPYGELTVHQVTGYGDRDGDGTVDATDKGTPGVTCTGPVAGACRLLDLDFDGDYDSADATLFDVLPPGLARHPGRTATGVRQPFGHQGLLWEGEVGSYQNRTRQYSPAQHRFSIRDQLGLFSLAQSPNLALFGEVSAIQSIDVDLPPYATAYGDGVNLYTYVLGHPTTSMDPLGTKCVGRCNRATGHREPSLSCSELTPGVRYGCSTTPGSCLCSGGKCAPCTICYICLTGRDTPKATPNRIGPCS